ncbi:hypothetical protein MHU86_10291 [Fragilaria crotonensis]|nr:hypothetical protein MHU86_10291 [Fragilaria crotonensis]
MMQCSQPTIDQVEAYLPDYPSKRIPIATVDNDLCVDERHRQHAQDSIFGIHVPSDQLTTPFILDGVVAGFDTRVPTQDELDDTSLHVELTSDVEWIPASFAHSLAEEESTADPVNERVSRLQTRRLKVLASKEGKHRIKCCLQTLSDTQSLFEIELANEVNMLNTGDPVLKRVAALTTGGDDTPNRRTFAIRTGASTSDVTPENVAKRWMIRVEAARTTLNVTTQMGIRSIPNPATRRFKTQMAHLRYPRVRAYPMERKNETIYALDDFVKKVGIPEVLLCDNDATTEGWSEWKKWIRKYSIDPKYPEPYCHSKMRQN